MFYITKDTLYHNIFVRGMFMRNTNGYMPYYGNQFQRSDDRIVGGGFLGPFILGGLTGGLVAPFFYGNGYGNNYYGRPNYYSGPSYYYGGYYYPAYYPYR